MASESTPSTDSGTPRLTRRPSRGATTTTFSMEVFDNEVVPSSLQQIAPILRVANEIQQEVPRVAYLCTVSSQNNYMCLPVIIITVVFKS